MNINFKTFLWVHKTFIYVVCVDLMIVNFKKYVLAPKAFKIYM
jgi:hypothetical protein